MDESALVLARAMVAEEREKKDSCTSSPDGSPAPLKKTILGRVHEKLQTFR